MQRMHRGRDRKTTVLIILTLVLIVGLVAATAFFAKNYYDLRQKPNKVAEDETKQLVDAVGKLYQLPRDETPVVAKVQDKEKLKDQPFFQNAENGDRILIYQGAKVAIVYREKENKLINVGPVAMDSLPAQGQASATVKVINAATKQGAADGAVNEIGEVAGISLDKTVTEAKKKNLTQTIVVDVTGKAEQARQIAEKLGAKLDTLPTDEDRPAADIAVFVGNR